MRLTNNYIAKKAISVSMCVCVLLIYNTPVNVMALTQSTQQAAVVNSNPMLMNVDSPQSNSEVTTSMLVRGWALNQSALKEVRVYIDGNFRGNATIGDYRPDVNAAYPGYPGGDRSGFRLTVNTSDLSYGSHTLTVEQTGLDNSKKSISVTIKKVQKQPITYIDYPTQNLNLSKNILVSGWALNDSGVTTVKIYLDNMFKGYASIGDSRPDVNAAYPGYPSADKSGYRYTLDTSNIAQGAHQIKVEAIGSNGTSKSTTTSFNYYVRKPMSVVDEPSANSQIGNNNFLIKGWALNPSGMKSIDLVIDGNYVGQADMGLPRPDVNNVYVDYDNSMNSGYQCFINIDTIKPGNHVFQVKFQGNDQTTEIKQFNLVINKPEPKTNVDCPTYNKTVLSDQLLIGGWSINASGISNVQVFVDGGYKGDATIGGLRQDVGNAYNSYKDSSNSGFNYVLSTSGMSVGKHDIKIVTNGRDGSSFCSYTSFYLKGIVNYVQYNNSFDYYTNAQITKGGNTYWDNTLATNDDVIYYMNPNNFINDDTYRYMFLKLNYTDGVSANNLNNALSGQGILNNKGQAFLDGGQNYNINPIYLVSHALHETNNGLSRLANGIVVTSVDGNAVEPKIVYNVYGIGALNSDPERLGSEYAYKQGWFSVESAIIGGAKFISTDYITSLKYQQNTLYKMKWNYTNVYHEYATDVNWARAQTVNIKKLIDKMDSPTLYFEVPTFK